MPPLCPCVKCPGFSAVPFIDDALVDRLTSQIMNRSMHTELTDHIAC